VQNSFNLRSGNGALVESSPKNGSCVLYPPPPKKKTPSLKEADLGDMFKKVFKNVCISTAVFFSDFLSLTPSASSAIILQKTQKRTLITLNQQTKEIAKWKTPLSSCPAEA
jgi:hypothetical protein